MWNKKNTDLIEEMQNAPYNVLQELQANTISGLASSKKIKGWKGLEAGLGLVSQITGSMSNSVRTNSGTKTTDLPIQDAISGTPLDISGTPLDIAEPAYDIWKMAMPMLYSIPTTPTANMSTPTPTSMQDIDIDKILQSALKEQTGLAPIEVVEPAYGTLKMPKPMFNTILTTSAANVSTPAPYQNLDGTGERKETKVDAKENPEGEAPPKQDKREDFSNKFKAGQIGSMKNMMGDAALIAGTLFTSLANRRNTDRQQQATLPNVNVFAGIQGYNDMLYQRQLQDIERQQNLQNQSIKSNLTAQLNNNKNNTRSSSVQRVLDATVYGQANKAHQQTSIQASQLRNRLDAQKQQMDMKADVYYRQGEAARRLADQQDIDNYYGQIAKDNTGMGETITRAASLINERSNQQRQQDYFTNSMLQQYGYAATEGGAFVKNKETGEITFQPFETKENPFLAFLRERLLKKGKE